MAIEIPHAAFPPSFTDGVMDVVEQDSAAHLAQRISVAAHTVIGDRIEDPTFGIPDDTHRAGGVDLDALRTALAASEPAAAVVVDRITGPTDLDHADVIRILIDED